MSDSPAAVLRVAPHTIPALLTAYSEAVEELRPVLARARHEAFMHEPWLGDPISLAVMRSYNGRFVTGDSSAHQQLLAYLTELTRIRDALADMAEAYRRTEGENAALWGRLA